MKFRTGDDTDAALCMALKHEFLRCDDAFNDFASSATIMITQGQNRRIAYKTYNAYARFVHHLYEFLLAAIARDRMDTQKLDSELADRYVTSHTQRILTNRRESILNGTAPAWENHISSYPEQVPPAFATEFRRCRNTIAAHAGFQRPSLNLSDFYGRYHMYLYMLYREVANWWGRIEQEFPDLGEITAFSVLIQRTDPH